MKHTARKLIHTDDDMFPFMPKDWISIPLKYVASCNDNLLPESTDKNYEFDYVDISSVKYGEGITGKQRMVFKDAPSRARRIVRVNDIIFSTVRTYLKAVANISGFDYPLIVSTGFAVIRAKKSVIFPNFMKYCLLSDGFISKIDKWSTGSNYPSINAPVIMNQKILLPSIPEQQQIAAYLDDKCAKIDEAIIKHRTLIEKLKEYRKAVITKAVTKGLDPNVEMKNSGIQFIGEVPSAWKTMKIRYVADIVRGGSPRPIDQYISTDDSGYNWIKIGDAVLGDKHIHSTKQRIIPEGLSKTRYVKKNTLILTNSMSFGHPYILDIDGCIHDGWLAFSNYKGVDKEFLYFFLVSDTCMSQFVTTADGSVVQNLNIDKVKNSFMAVPSIEEQKEIVNALDTKCAKIDEAIARHEGLITKLEEYKKSIIYNAVTGKIDCRKDAE